MPVFIQTYLYLILKKLFMTQDQSLQSTKNEREIPSLVYKWVYALFVMLSFYYILFTNDFITGLSNMSIALIFDPFDQKIMWKNRPNYQIVWLIIHLTVLAGLFIYGIWFR